MSLISCVITVFFLLIITFISVRLLCGLGPSVDTPYDDMGNTKHENSGTCFNILQCHNIICHWRKHNLSVHHTLVADILLSPSASRT